MQKTPAFHKIRDDIYNSISFNVALPVELPETSMGLKTSSLIIMGFQLMRDEEARTDMTETISSSLRLTHYWGL